MQRGEEPRGRSLVSGVGGGCWGCMWLQLRVCVGGRGSCRCRAGAVCKRDSLEAGCVGNVPLCLCAMSLCYI